MHCTEQHHTDRLHPDRHHPDQHHLDHPGAPTRADPTTRRLVHRTLAVGARRLHERLVELGPPARSPGAGPSAGAATRIDRRNATALCSWFDGYHRTLLAQLRTESELLLPALAVSTDALEPHLARLEHLHGAVARSADLTQFALRRLSEATAGSGPVAARLTDAAAHARELGDRVAEWCEMDDAEVVPLIVRHLEPIEYAALEHTARREVARRTRRFAMTMLLDDLSAVHRNDLLASWPVTSRWDWATTRPGYRRLRRRGFGDG